MSKLDKARDALKMAAKHKYGDGDYTAFFEEALTELNAYIDRLKSKELVEEISNASYDACVKTYNGSFDGNKAEVHNNIAKAVINIIKGKAND